jgi:choline-glycine betaine transporter
MCAVALPFVVVMLLLCWALLKELREAPGAGLARHHGLHGLRDVVGDAVTGQGPARHHRPRRVAKARREGGDAQ